MLSKYLNIVADYIIKIRNRHNISQQNFILFLSFIIAIFGGFASIILKNTVHFTADFLSTRFPSEQ